MNKYMKYIYSQVLIHKRKIRVIGSYNNYYVIGLKSGDTADRFAITPSGIIRLPRSL